MKEEPSSISAGATPLPWVSLVIAVHGVDEFTEHCLNSLVDQAYPGPIEFIFSAQTDDDPVLDLVRSMRASRSGGKALPWRSLVHTVRPGLTAVASNLHYGTLAAKGDVVILCTDDVTAPPDAVKRLVAALGSGFGLVSAAPRFIRPGNLPARVYALFYNTAVQFSWTPAVRLGVCAAWGGMMAARRSDLEAFGGLLATEGRVAEDLALARVMGAQGHRTAIAGEIQSPVGRMSWPELWNTLNRIAFIGTCQNPFGNTLSFLVFPLLYGYLILPLVALVLGSAKLAVAGVGIFFLRAWVAGVSEVMTGGAFRFAWGIAIADAMHAAALLRAVVCRRFLWQGVEYRFHPDGSLRSK